MPVYRFRVYIEDDHEVYRDIDILGKQRFADLHREVIRSFNFQSGQVAEYLHSDQSWYEGDTVVELDAKLEGDHQKIVSHITVPRQRFICVTSSYKQIGLALELQKVLQEEPNVAYPRTAKSEGEPPYYTQPPPEPITDDPAEEAVPELELDDFDEDGPSEEEIERLQKAAEKASKAGLLDAPKVNMNKLKKKAKKKDDTDKGFEAFDMDDLM